MALDPAEIRTTDVAARALERARDHLLSLQQDAGWWKAELETNVTMDAEDLLLRQFLGIRDEETTRLAAAWIRSQQGRPTARGTSTTAAPRSSPRPSRPTLRCDSPGDPADAEHMKSAAARRSASIGRTRAGARVSRSIWLAIVR